MNGIKKQIFKTISEIIFIIFLIVGTYILWDNLEINKYKDIAANAYNNGTVAMYEKEVIAEDSLLPLNDELAMVNVKPGVLHVENSVQQEKSYTLFLAIDKNSTLDYKLLNISIDNNIYDLNEVETIEEDGIILIMFDNYTIVDTIEHEVRIWLDENSAKEAMGKSLTFGFNLKENSQI